jgi:ribosomal protein S18 acetylase RimI-like enzyme
VLSSFVIRPALADDLPALLEISSAMGNGEGSEYFIRQFAEQERGHRNIFILLIDGDSAGYVVYNRTPLYALFSRLAIPEIQDLCVVPAYRQQGHGRALVEYCETIALAENCETIGIAVGVTADFGAAQRLYVKMGYIPDGFGLTCDREPVRKGERVSIDDGICLMLTKDLGVLLM